MIGTPEPKRMRKPRFCDSCHSKEWPAFGIGCPCFRSERPPELRDVYLWHCGAAGCAADCMARYAGQLRKIGRSDLAGKLTGETRNGISRMHRPCGKFLCSEGER